MRTEYVAWTAQDEALLKELSARLTMPEAAEAMGRSHSSIKTRSSRLGISFPRQAWGVESRPWTSEEEALLLELAPTTSYAALGDLLGRSVAAVNTRACQLNANGRPVGKYRGETDSRWRGGHSGWRGEDWKEVSQAIRKNSDFTCADCGVRGLKLVVHHIIPYRYTQDNSVENLVALCVPDHLRRPEHKATSLEQVLQIIETSKKVANLFPGIDAIEASL